MTNSPRLEASKLKRITRNSKVEISEYQDQSFASARVLIVEDNALSRVSLGRELEKWGILPEYAVDGKHALYRLNNEEWDVVLIDISMPKMDGLDVCRSFYESNPSSDVPIVAVSASSTEELREKALECGMKGVFAKEHLARMMSDILTKYLG
ncbi:MAG: response regulator [Flavobacteriia bacterium]|nr:response regulator [Flavobacteriia bacterium]